MNRRPWYSRMNFGLVANVGRWSLGFDAGPWDYGNAWGVRLHLIWWQPSWHISLRRMYLNQDTYTALAARAGVDGTAAVKLSVGETGQMMAEIIDDFYNTPRELRIAPLKPWWALFTEKWRVWP